MTSEENNNGWEKLLGPANNKTDEDAILDEGQATLWTLATNMMIGKVQEAIDKEKERLNVRNVS